MWKKLISHSGTLSSLCQETDFSTRYAGSNAGYRWCCALKIKEMFISFKTEAVNEKCCIWWLFFCELCVSGYKWSAGAFGLWGGHPDTTGHPSLWIWQRFGCICASLLWVSSRNKTNFMFFLIIFILHIGCLDAPWISCYFKANLRKFSVSAGDLRE